MTDKPAISRRTALRLALASAPAVAGLAVAGPARANVAARSDPAPYIEIIDAAARTTGDVRPPKGTPGTVQYEDLYRTGMTLQQVFTAASAAVSPATQVRLSFPPGVFMFSDFTQNNMYGIRIPINVGIAGSGRDGANATVLRMAPFSSTKGPQVPVRNSGLTNQFTYLGIQNSGAAMPPSGMRFENFALLGSDQGHLYNGFRLQHCDRPIIRNLYCGGFAGDAAAPPGETFGINLYMGQGAQLINVEVNGIRTRQGGLESVGSSPVGHNNHNDSVMTDCYFHHNKYGMPTYWQCSGNLTVNCRSEYNRTGFNHERTTNITHRNPTIKLGALQPHHFSSMNDQANGSLTVENPTWDLSSASPSGKLVFYMGPRGTGVVDVQTSGPTVTGANGESIMDRVLVAGN